jgi:hypothetical protein
MGRAYQTVKFLVKTMQGKVYSKYGHEIYVYLNQERRSGWKFRIARADWRPRKTSSFPLLKSNRQSEGGAVKISHLLDKALVPVVAW